MTNVLLYSVQPILAEGLQVVMKDFAGFQLIECCATTDSLTNQVKGHRPELLLIELTPAITLDFLRELMGISRRARIVLWMDDASPEFLSHALGIGVRGILGKGQSIVAYGQCLRSIAAGEIWLDQELAGRLLSRKQVRLSARERQVIGLLARGLKNKEIAQALDITEGTVKVYLSRLFDKVGANDRFDLALMGLRNVEANQSNAFDRVARKSASRAVPFSIPSYLSTESLSAA